jgi:hypothetical protein
MERESKNKGNGDRVRKRGMKRVRKKGIERRKDWKVI